MNADTLGDLLRNLIIGLPAIFLAVAAYRKVSLTFVHVAELEKKLAAQDTRINVLEKENGELREQNRELHEQNTVLAGVNEEYRKRLLPALGNGKR